MGRPRSLEGRTILVTRPAEQAGPLVGELKRRGARVLVAPSIRLVPARSSALTRALRELTDGGFAWITLTSAATVDVLRDRLSAPSDVRAKVAAIGDGTAAAFRRWSHREPDLEPPTFTTTALARAFPSGSGRVLCARADIAPEGLEHTLARKGWEPTRVDAYRTVFARSLPRQVGGALARGEVDAVTFTSASTVRGFADALRDPPASVRTVAIGPVTAAAAREHGFDVVRVARPHTIDGLVEAVERALARSPRGTLRS